MLLKLMGLMDLLCAITLFFLHFGLFKVLGWVCLGYLILKAFMFIKSWATLVDALGVVFIFLAIFGVFVTPTWIFVFWYFQKGLFSMFS